MDAPRKLRWNEAGRLGLLAGVATLGLLTQVGCQAEYGGMTLPSGKYMYDDVQYFAPGPEFPWANTLAASQRSRMLAQGIEPAATPPPPMPAPPGGFNVQSGEPESMVPNPPAPAGNLDPDRDLQPNQPRIPAGENQGP
jgi:hypothetical protein